MLITQSWRITADCWPKDGRLLTRPAPLQEIAGARVYDFYGNARTIDTQAFVVDKAASQLVFGPWALGPGRWALPQPGHLAAGIELDVTVGFGDAVIDVPEPLRQATWRNG